MQLINKRPASDPAQLAELRERERRFQLARVLRVTEQMLEEARLGDWEKVEEMEAWRRVEMEACFSAHDTNPSQLVAEAMATLLYLNDQLVQLVRYARSQVHEEHESHSRTVHAVRAYSELEP